MIGILFVQINNKLRLGLQFITGVNLFALERSRSTFIGGVGGLQRLMCVYTYGLSVVRIRGSSHPCGNIPDDGSSVSSLSTLKS